MGGSGDETGRWLEVVDGTDVVLTGSAGSSNFPTTSGAYDTGHNGNLDVFVLRFDGLASGGGPPPPPPPEDITDNTGEAEIDIGEKKVTVRPFNPLIPGQPLPGIKVTAKDYASHVILIWEETCEDHPPPYFMPVVEMLKKPITFDRRVKALAQAVVSSETTELQQVVVPARTDLGFTLYLPSIFYNAIGGPKGWDVPGSEIAPSPLKDYGDPKTSIAGKDFPKYMADNYPEVKSIIFYHDKAVATTDDLMADIYESGDKTSIAVRIRDKSSPPGSLEEIVATKFMAEKACDKTKADEYETALDWAKDLADKELDDLQKECVVVPDVKGKPVQEAKSILQEKGFVVEEKKDYSSAPKDSVTGQDPGPEGLGKCAVKGRAVELEVSRGAEPREYTLYEAEVYDTNGKAKGTFEACESVELWLKGKNSTGAPLDVRYDWETTAPNGQVVDWLSLENLRLTEPPGEALNHWISSRTPALSGQYKFVGSATFKQNGSTITKEEQTSFKVAPFPPQNIRLQEALTCRNVSDDGEYSGVTTNFTTNDDRVYSWFWWEEASGKHTVEWRWYQPNGSLYLSYDLSWDTISCGYLTWGWIGIRGAQAEDHPGRWHVDMYLDGNKVTSLSFSINRAASSSGEQSPVMGEKDIGGVGGSNGSWIVP
jgi:hypothetical protein